MSHYISFKGEIKINKSISCEEKVEIYLPKPFHFGEYGTRIYLNDDINSTHYDDFIESLYKIVADMKNRGYYLNGKIKWGGEYHFHDKGIIYIDNNEIDVYARMPKGMSWWDIYQLKNEHLYELIKKEDEE